MRNGFLILDCDYMVTNFCHLFVALLLEHHLNSGEIVWKYFDNNKY